VLAGQVASNKAGPGVILSFAFAALASAFSALCYAEFAGKVPRAGSAYAYSYITVGEFVAFVIGWNLVLEYVIGASSVARGFSEYLRYVFNHVMLSFSHDQQLLHLTNPKSNFTFRIGHPVSISLAQNNSSLMIKQAVRVATISQVNSTAWYNTIINYVVQYFDWPSVIIIFVITLFILFGVKESTNVTLAFTTLNLIVVVVVVGSSISYLDLHNWRLDRSEVPAGYGNGGFIPYGWSGVLAGSATCFFGFIGFDTIASSAEEAKNPKRNVPLSIILSLFISFLAYMAIAIVQTLLWPYYDQNKPTILPHIFGKLDMQITYWIVLVGAIAGLASSQLGGMYPLPRIIYSMANDKLIYSYLSNVNRRLKLPVRATIVGSIFVALLACLLDIQDLADMVSIGTLAAYTLVSLSVLILRYEDRRDAVDDSTILSNHLTLVTDLTANNSPTIVEDPSDTIEGLPKFRSMAGDRLSGEEGKQQDFASNVQGKARLTAKHSTPIREKGSRAIVPQLSVGFHSWFKSAEMDDIVAGGIDSVATAQQAKERGLLDLLLSWKRDEQATDQLPNDHSSGQSKILIAAIMILSIALNAIAVFGTLPSFEDDSIGAQMHIDPRVWFTVAGFILFVALLVIMLMLSRLPTSKRVSEDVFQVPLVPLVPTLSILINIFLMLNLSYLTWVRFTVWMAAGLFIYFSYGIWNSEGYLLYLNR